MDDHHLNNTTKLKQKHWTQWCSSQHHKIEKKNTGLNGKLPSPHTPLPTPQNLNTIELKKLILHIPTVENLK
jgi:hypothetical protein